MGRDRSPSQGVNVTVLPPVQSPRAVRRAYLHAAIAITLFALGLHFDLMPRVADVDSFYHLRHSWVYRVQGIFDSSFPWAQFSTVKTQASDLWYGFHILTIPLTLFEPLTNGLYVGGVLVTIVSLLLVWIALRQLPVQYPLFWTFFFALINADVLYRLTMLRPHPLSLGLLLLLFTLMVAPPARNNRLAVFAVAALFAWNHIVVFWLAILVVAAVTGVRLLHRQLPDWHRLGAFFAGLALGVLLRPHPMGALQLTYTVVEMMVMKRADVLLNVGKELYPFGWDQFVALFIPLTVILLVGLGLLGVLLRRRGLASMDRDQRIALWSSLALSAAFCAMTFLVARRAHELFVAFGTIFLALLLPYARSLAPATWVSTPQPAGIRWVGRLALQAKVLLLVATVGGTVAVGRNLYLFHQILESTFHPSKFEAVGKWLTENAEPGAIVFHPHWDRFGELFFWNPRSYYISGMDPIFHYTYDKRTYWQAFYMAIDRATKSTCSSYPCERDSVIWTHDSLQREFGASWVVVEMNRNPKLYETLRTTAGFTRMLETDGNVAVFRVD